MYGFFRKDCYERSDFFTYENRCLQHSATKILGYAVIVACLIFKLPQMYKIIEVGSVEGMSSFAAVTELLAYLQTMTYARHLGLDFSVYGETLLLSISSAIVLLLIFFYESKIGQHAKMLLVGVIALYAHILIVDNNISEQTWNTISGSTIFLAIMSRGRQFYTNYVNDSTG